MLRQAQHDMDRVLEYIYGRKPVLEALAGPRRVFQIFLAAPRKHSKVLDQIAGAAKKAGVKLVETDNLELQGLAGDAPHQGVVAEVAPFQYVALDPLLATTAAKERALVVLLDGVTDPQNFGAVIRTAMGADADGLIVSKHGAAPVTAAVVKASAGTVERATVIATNLNSAIDKLKDAGFWIVGADADASAPIWEIDLSGKIAFVFGGEGAGLSRLVKEKCDFLAKLPLAAPVESLNVSAAAAVMIYEAVRQRMKLTDVL